MTACPICSALAGREEGHQKYGWPEHDVELPPAVQALAVAKDFRPGAERQRKILRCPHCDACYLFETDYEYLTNGSENEQRLTRLTSAQAAKLLQTGDGRPPAAPPLIPVPSTATSAPASALPTDEPP